MGFGRVTQTVHVFHNRVHCGIVTDCIVGAGNIVVNCAGNTDAGNAAKRKVARAAERAVAADNDNALHIHLLADINCFLHALFGFEFGASCGIQNCTAAVDDIGNTSEIHFIHIAVHKAVIAAANAHYTKTVFATGANHRANSCVHTRRVAAACQNTNRFHFFHLIKLFREYNTRIFAFVKRNTDFPTKKLFTGTERLFCRPSVLVQKSRVYLNQRPCWKCISALYRYNTNKQVYCRQKSKAGF